MAKAKTNYIDNQKFLEQLIEYKNASTKAEKNKTEKPVLSDEIGLAFMQIAERLSRKPNFMAYSFREEMISDAIENCVKYVDNFNPEVSHNPFSYFTQIIYFAFLRRIDLEKKHLYAKYKATEQFAILNDNMLHNTEDGGIDISSHLYENISDFIKTFEDKKASKKKPQKVQPKGIEKFLEV